MPRLQTIIQSVLLRELGSLRREVEAYPDDASIWAHPPGAPNPGGTLVLHLAGNLQHYVGAVLGDTGYVRDRDAEFSRRGVSRAELVDQIGAAERAVGETLAAISDERLAGSYPETVGGHEVETGEFLIHLAVHLGYHLGQLDYHRRLVTGDARAVGTVNIARLSTAQPR